MSPLRGLKRSWGQHFAIIMPPLRGYLEGGRLMAEGGMNTITNYELRITEPLDFLFITSYFSFYLYLCCVNWMLTVMPR
jgi:hypothetical protein